MRPVNTDPPLPHPTGGEDNRSLGRFDADLISALHPIVFEIAYRLNGMLAKDGSEALAGYTVANLGTPAAGAVSFASNGRKVGEGSGAGTGVPVYGDGIAWRRYADDTTVVA